MPIINHQQERSAYCVLLLLAFFSFYFLLGAYPLLDNNEGLYASIANNMLQQKTWIIPRLNGLPYIEKPPLLYWLLSISLTILGPTAWACRFVTATSGALVALMLFYFLRKLKQPTISLYAAIIFCSSLGVAIIARMVYFDMLFTLLTTATLLCWFYWYHHNHLMSLRCGYLFLGLAILCKGLIAIILVGITFALFLHLEGRLKMLVKMFDLVGLMLFTAVVVPWHVAASLQHSGFAKQYFIVEHFLRFLSQREPHDYYSGPIYYYLPRILIYLFPWSLFLGLSWVKDPDSSTATKTLLRFCWCWLGWPLLFFSISRAKANYYMIVSIPAMVIILAHKLHHATPKLIKLLAVSTCFLLVGGTTLFYLLASDNLLEIKRLLLWVAVYSLLIGISLVGWAQHRKTLILLFSTLAIPISIAISYYVTAHSQQFSAYEIGHYLKKSASSQKLYLYKDFEKFSAIAFYAPSFLTMIDSQSSDLYYGQHLEAFQKFFITHQELGSLPRNAVIIVPTGKLAEFYRYLDPQRLELLKYSPRLVVLRLHHSAMPQDTNQGFAHKFAPMLYS